jgi:hypothetical protein
MKGLDEVEKKIKKMLRQVVNDSHAGTELGRDKNKWWTIRIKDGLCQLGHNMNCVVSANGCECADEKEEWLFDMVWTFPIGNWNEIKLAMECEWSLDEGEIWRDFEKLLVVRSKHRVFIFNQSNENKVKKMMKEFRESINNFKDGLPGDRYFLAGYSVDLDDFIFNNIVVP